MKGYNESVMNMHYLFNILMVRISGTCSMYREKNKVSNEMLVRNIY
jgi:hypothetical protein